MPTSESQLQKRSANERIAVVLETMATKAKLSTNDKRWISKKLKEMEPTFWDRFWHWFETDDNAIYILMVLFGIAGVLGTRIIEEGLESILPPDPSQPSPPPTPPNPMKIFPLYWLIKFNPLLNKPFSMMVDSVPGYQTDKSFIDNILCGAFGASAAIGLYMLILKALWKNGAPQGTGSVLATLAGGGLIGAAGFALGDAIADLP